MTYEVYRRRVVEACERMHYGSAAKKSILQAFDAAYRYHQDSAPRLTGEPFISHPVAAVELLADFNIRDAVAWCAILGHDVLEETRATEENIRLSFGEMAGRHIMALSTPERPEGISSTSWRQGYFETFSHATCDRVFLCKCVDRLHNLRTSHVLPEFNQRRNVDETRAYLIPRAREIRGRLANALEAACAEIEARLETVAAR